MSLVTFGQTKKKYVCHLKLKIVRICTHTADFKGISVIFLLLLLAIILKIDIFNFCLNEWEVRNGKKIKIIEIICF